MGHECTVSLPVCSNLPAELSLVKAVGTPCCQAPVGFSQAGLAEDFSGLVGLSVLLEAELPARLGKSKPVAGGDPAEEARTDPEMRQLRGDPESILGVGDRAFDEPGPGQCTKSLVDSAIPATMPGTVIAW